MHLLPTRALTALALAVPSVACTQVPHSARGSRSGSADSTASSAVTASMGGTLVQGSHLQMTPVRAPVAGDEERAGRVLAELRDGLGKFADYRVAEASGYKQFLPGTPQKVYHFTNYRRSIAEALAFDAARPSSLLYEMTATGGFKLVGAMYHAPQRASMEQLDERIPLSIARWHRHVNLCFPVRGDTARWRETKNGVPLFGPLGSIATEEDCDATGGRFVENLFGWMVHVNAFASDPKVVWGSEDGAHDHKAGH